MKTTSDNLLDSMDLRGDVSCRSTRDLTNRRRVFPFQVKQHDLPIQRFELVDKFQEPIQIALPAHRLLTASLIRRFLQHVEADKVPQLGLPQYVRRCHVVGYAVDPCPKRASPLESRKASPQRDVNLLQQVAALIGVGLMGTGEPSERRTMLGGDLLIQVVLAQVFR